MSSLLKIINLLIHFTVSHRKTSNFNMCFLDFISTCHFRLLQKIIYHLKKIASFQFHEVLPISITLIYFRRNFLCLIYFEIIICKRLKKCFQWSCATLTAQAQQLILLMLRDLILQQRDSHSLNGDLLLKIFLPPS